MWSVRKFSILLRKRMRFTQVWTSLKLYFMWTLLKLTVANFNLQLRFQYRPSLSLTGSNLEHIKHKPLWYSTIQTRAAYTGHLTHGLSVSKTSMVNNLEPVV